MKPTGDRLRHANLMKPHPEGAESVKFFAYGTLTREAVVSALISRVPEHRSWTAHGWKVCSLKELPYPGLIADPTHTARGVLYSNLTLQEWQVIDLFEDDRYDLVKISVGESDEALTYAWTGPTENDEWRISNFTETHEHIYLANIEKWREKNGIS